jgi:hypothetical protein
MYLEPKPDLSTWPEEARKFALALIEILSDEKRARLSEYMSTLRQRPPTSTDPDQDYDIKLLRHAAIGASPRHNILYSGGELTRPCLGNIRLTSVHGRTAHRRRS